MNDFQNSVEKQAASFANANMDVDSHALNNRIQFLIPHTFHATLMEKELKDKSKEIEEAGDDFDGFKDKNFCPAKLLKEKILDQISSVQVLVFGNTSQVDALKFCKNIVKPTFKTMLPDEKTVNRSQMQGACMFPEISLTKDLANTYDLDDKNLFQEKLVN